MIENFTYDGPDGDIDPFCPDIDFENLLQQYVTAVHIRFAGEGGLPIRTPLKRMPRAQSVTGTSVNRAAQA